MRIKDVTLEAKKPAEVPISWTGCDAALAESGFRPVSEGFGNSSVREKTYRDNDGFVCDVLAPSTKYGRTNWALLVRVDPKSLKTSRTEARFQKVYLPDHAPLGDEDGAMVDTREQGEAAVQHIETCIDTYGWARAVESETDDEPFLQGRILLYADHMLLSGAQVSKSRFDHSDLSGGLGAMLEWRDDVFDAIQTAARRCGMSRHGNSPSEYVFSDGTKAVSIQSKRNLLTTGISITVRGQRTQSAGNITMTWLSEYFAAAASARQFPWDQPLS